MGNRCKIYLKKEAKVCVCSVIQLRKNKDIEKNKYRRQLIIQNCLKSSNAKILTSRLHTEMCIVIGSIGEELELVSFLKLNQNFALV